MEIERLVYECSKVGIEKDYSGGQIYSYTKGMKTLLANTELNLLKLADYEQPVDFEADPEKNIAPMSFTYRQMDTLFPKQFRFKAFQYGNKRLFAFSNNKLSVDWDQYADYDAYLNVRKNEDMVVGGRSGAHEFYILVGALNALDDFPCMYYQSASLKMPYTAQDLCSPKKPDYMSALQTVFIGDTITKESVRQFLAEERERINMLKKMAYCLLRYKKTEQCDYAKNLVICDAHEIIIYWIAALSFLFSKDMAKEISFSTYEYSPMGADYRICGAFQRGTDYDANTFYRECYVFDFCNQRFEEAEGMQDTELYGFLVNSFLYVPEALDKFYEFISKFDFAEVSAELENAFELYRFLYMNKQNSKMDARQFRMAADFAKYCKDDTETKKILVSLINAYVVMSPQESEECEEAITQLLGYFSEYTEYLEKLCATRMVEMLMPDSGVALETIKAVFEKYDSLFSKANGHLFLIYYGVFQQNADKVLMHNANLQHNIYIAQMIYRYMRERTIEISHISPSYTEGKFLHIIVGNILAQNLTTGQLKDCIKNLTDFYQGNTYEYLYLLMELEGMVRDYTGNMVQEWINVSEVCIEEYINTNSVQPISGIYKALARLECEDKILKNIEKRSRTNETFDSLFDDVEELLAGYGRQLKEHKPLIYKMLLNAAENKDNTWNNLTRILGLRSNGENDEIFLQAADSIVKHMDMRTDSVDDELLESLIALYEQNRVQADAKLAALKILKEMDSDLAKGKKHIHSKYEKLSLRNNPLEFPKISETMRYQFFDDYCSRVMEIYVICGNIQVIDYFNSLFQISESETADLMELELRTLAKEYKRADVELFCELITYSFLLVNKTNSRDMAAMLNENRINFNKMNKYFNEKNKELLKDLYAKLRLQGTSEQERKNLLAYWNDIFNLANEGDTNLVKKVMKTFLKR